MSFPVLCYVLHVTSSELVKMSYAKLKKKNANYSSSSCSDGKGHKWLSKDKTLILLDPVTDVQKCLSSLYYL